jgi:hypothetical protein
VFRELEEAKDDESFLDEECEDRWTEADKRLMGPLLGKNCVAVLQIRNVYPGSDFYHPRSRVDKIPNPNHHQRI